MSMLWVILVAAGMVAITGYSIYNLRLAGAKLADAQNELASSRYRLNAVVEQRKPISAKLRETERVIKEADAQIKGLEGDLKTLVDKNNEIKAKIDSY